MKNPLVILLIFIFSACSTSSDKNDTNEKHSKFNFIKTFEGKIDDKHSIVAKLECKNNLISGHYFYLGNSGEMELKGEFTSKKNFTIEEFNLKGRKTGSFEGEYIDGKLEGKWSNAKGEKSYSFYLIESNTSYSPTEITNDISGEYTLGTNTLKISKVNKREFVAEFCLGSLNCEMGCYIGEFVLAKDGFYNGNLPDLNPNKYINISVVGNELKVESNYEVGMDMGARCGLDGNYIK